MGQSIVEKITCAKLPAVDLHHLENPGPQRGDHCSHFLARVLSDVECNSPSRSLFTSNYELIFDFYGLSDGGVVAMRHGKVSHGTSAGRV